MSVMDAMSRRFGLLGELDAKPRLVDPLDVPTTRGGDLCPLAWAQVCGRRDGAAYDGNPWQMARDEGLAVQAVTPARLCALRGRSARSVNLVAGFYHAADWPAKPTIYLDASLSERQQALTVAHELAHYHHANWTEDDCEAYAVAFVGAWL